MYSSLILYSLMLAVVFFSLRKVKKPLIKKLGFRETKLGEESLMGFFYLGALLVAAFVLGILFYTAGFEQDMSKVPAIIEQIGVTKVLIVLLVGSVVEEIFFRGYLQRKTNLLFASFMFSYFHIIYGSFSEIIGAFFLGLILGIAYQRTKNLYVPIFAHIFYNLITVFLIFVVV